MKKLLFSVFITALSAFAAFSQTNDTKHNEQIKSIEKKVTAAKSAIPAAEEKKYYAVLSDVENRKNAMKMMLKTPSDKRDAEWNRKWDENYSKAMEKLGKLD